MSRGGYLLPLGDRHRYLGIAQSKLANNAEVYYLDYRTAPQHKYPAALEDAVALFKGLLDNGYKAENIILVGDSAGGNLALALSLYLRDNDISLPGLLVLISPWTTLENKLPSRNSLLDKDLVLGRNTPLLSEVISPSYAKNIDLKIPYLSPIYADLKNLPPMLIQTGGFEIFLDENLLLSQNAHNAGVTVTQTVYDGMPHDFALLLPELNESVNSFIEIENFINQYMP